MNPQAIKLALLLNDSQFPVDKEARPTGPGNGNAGLFSDLLRQAMKPADGHLPAAGNSSNTNEIRPDWLEYFHNKLIQMGTPVKDLSISRKALPYLKGILVGHGYSESAAAGILDKIFQGGSGHEIKLAELFERLSDLNLPSKKKSLQPSIEIAAIPYLEASLLRLGLDQVAVRTVMDQAMERGGQLSLGRLCQGLRRIMSQAPGSKQLSVDGDPADGIRGMLARAGLIDDGKADKGPISLERFIRMLEEKVAALTPRSQTEDEIRRNVDGLVENVLASKREKHGKSSEESFYAHKAKSLPDSDAQAGRETSGEWKTSTADVAMKSRMGEKVARLQERQDKLLCQAERPREAEAKGIEKGVKGQDKTAMACLFREAIIDHAAVQGGAVRKAAGPVIPAYVVNQVSRQIASSLGRGENHITIQLKPPHLGSVRIDMNIENSVLRVEMLTEHSSARDILISHIQELKESLIQQGVKLDRVDVQVSYNFGQSMAQARRGQHGFDRRGQGQRGGIGMFESLDDFQETMTAQMIRADALLDLMA